eukprot:PhM_4_TR11658/c3_g1_i6/m.16516
MKKKERSDPSSSHHKHITPAAMQDNFSKRRISVMLINVRGFHPMMDANSAGTVAMHSRLILGIVDAVKKNRGTPDVFLGDRFLATWNTVTRATTHRTMA